MPIFRIDKVGELCRQLSFTPQETRGTQLAGAEALLLEIDPAKAYPLDFIVYRITGYRPKVKDQPLLTGLALQHDLGLLIEQVSQTLNLRVQDAAQPVMGIDEVCERFNVTSKTIQRWRRRGLGARRMVFADGKRRIGFLLGTVERFLAIHRDQVLASVNFTPVSAGERQEILRRARRLAVQCHCSAGEISRRIGRRLHRSPLMVMHLLAQHDRENPAAAILCHAAGEIGAEEGAEISRAAGHGTTIAALARRLGRSRADIYHVIVQERLARLNRRKVRFIDDPLYHQPDAAAVIEQIVAQEELALGGQGEELRIPRDLPPYLQDLYRTPLLSPPRERALFLKLNFHKYQFVTARRQIEAQSAGNRDLNLLEGLRRRMVEAKNDIVRANLRLVVSVARKHLRPGLSLMDLISDGNLTLIRAVDSYDLHRGNRFSTYATFALMKGFARSVPHMQAADHQAIHSDVMLQSLPDGRHARWADEMQDRDEVGQLLSRLEKREREVILAHYGLGQARPATFQQLGWRMGLSKQRVREIEHGAMAKLRAGRDSL